MDIQSQEHKDFLSGLLFEEYNGTLRAQMKSFYNTHKIKNNLPKVSEWKKMNKEPNTFRYTLEDDRGVKYDVVIAATGLYFHDVT